MAVRTFYNYYRDYDAISPKAKKAASCVLSNPISKVKNEVSIFHSLVKAISYNWDDQGESSFANSKNKMLSTLSNLEASLSSYSQAEQAYVSLDKQLDLLKENTKKLYDKYKKEPRIEQYTYIDKYQINGVEYKKEVVRNDLFDADYREWEQSINKLHDKCHSMCESANEYINYLNSVNGTSVSSGSFSISFPNTQIVGMIDDLFDDWGSYGVDQNITHSVNYTIKDWSLIEPYLDLIYQKNSNFGLKYGWSLDNQDSFLNSSAFTEIGNILIDEFDGDLSKVSDILTGAFSRVPLSAYNDKEVVNYIISKYDYDEYESWRILDSMNNVGVCDYASFTSSILSEFKNKPEEFQKIFGFPMYVENDGKLVINDEMLMADIYISINSNSKISSKGQLVAGTNGEILSKNMRNLSDQYKIGCNSDTISQYFDSLDTKINYNCERVSVNNLGDDLSSYIDNCLNEDKQINIIVDCDETTFYSTDKDVYSPGTIKGNGYHQMYITLRDSNGVYLVNQGKKVYMLNKDLEEHAVAFDIVDIDLKGI